LKPKREIERQRVGKESGIYRLENTFIWKIAVGEVPVWNVAVRSYSHWDVATAQGRWTRTCIHLKNNRWKSTCFKCNRLEL
jgi:hypothetical protein